MEIYNINGRLTADPIMRVTNGGESVLSFSVACDRYKEDTKYYNCKLFGKRGTQLEKLLKKGMNVSCVGEPRMTEYNGKMYENLMLLQATPIFTEKKETTPSEAPQMKPSKVDYDPKTAQHLANVEKQFNPNAKASDFCSELEQAFGGTTFDETEEDVSDIPF